MPLKLVGTIDQIESQQAPVQQSQPTGQSRLKFVGTAGAQEQPPPTEEKKESPGLLDFLLGVGELGLTAASGAIAEPVSGLAGMVAAPFVGMDKAGKVIETVQEIGTYKPKTESAARTAQAVGEAVQPIIEKPMAAYKSLADKAAEKAGPAAGAAIMTAPALAIELIGLKGTRAAKKMALKTTVNKKTLHQFYDADGFLKRDIEEAIKDSGLSIDDVADVLPEKLDTAKAAQQQVEQIKSTAGARVGTGGKMEELVESADLNPEIIEAAREFDVDKEILASHASENPVYRSVEQGLKSIPASQLSMQEKRLIEQMGEKADELIKEFGGQIDKTELSDRFRADSKKLIDDLGNQAEEAYKTVSENIAPNTPVQTDNIISELNQIADDLGGMEYLDKNEKMLLKTLDPATNPTYARLDKYRRQIGNAMRGKESVFKNSDYRTLSRLYNRLTKDQEAVADAAGVGDLYKTAKGLVVERKAIENQLTGALGKQLQDNIMTKAKTAMLPMMKGNTSRFDALLENIPKQVGKETRQNIVASALNDAFTIGSRKEKSLNIPGFDDFMNGIKRNRGAYNRLEKELGKANMKRLESFHKLVGGVRRAQAEAITTGRTLAVPGMFDEVENLASRLYGTGKKIAAAEGVSTVVGMPGAGTAGVIGHMLSARKVKRSVAADELLSSPKFRNLMKEFPKADTPKKARNLEKIIENLKAYKKWKETIPERDLKDLMAVGALGYLSGQTLGDIEK